MSVSMSIPFALDASGLVAAEQSEVTALGQRVTALASTQPGERVMATNFGIDTASLLFNMSGASVTQVMGIALKAKMKVYEPGATLTSLQAVSDGAGVSSIVATAAPVAGSASSSASSTVTVRADGTVVTQS